MIKHNMGKNERLFRVMLGIAVVLVGWFMIVGMMGLGVLPAVVLIAGVVLMITGILAFCPLNALLHFNTCSECHKGEPHQHLPV